MNEQNEPNEQSEQPLSLAEAALRLGLSRDAVRMRLARGRLRGTHAGRTWLVYLNGARAERTEQNSSHNRTNRTEPMFSVDQAARIAELEADKLWLRGEVERRGVELSEMRRLLGNAQQYALLTAAALPETTAAAPVNGRPRWAERLAAMFGRS